MFSNNTQDRHVRACAGIWRRDLVAVGVSLILLIGTVMTSCEPSDTPTRSSSLTVVSYGGGAYQDSHRKAFCAPFSEITGVPVQSVVWNADYGKLKTMVESGNVTWDVVEVTAAQFARGKREGLFAPLTVRPQEGEFLPNTVSSHGVANVYWGTVLAFRQAEFAGRQPRTWADFWNVTEFPGARALYDDPRGNLEFALLADGVPRDKLYPLDVNRSFRKLDQIKPHVRVWWSDGTQPVQLLLTKAVALTSAWNGRIYSSVQARAELSYSWDGAALELDYWVVPKGSPNGDVASRFILFASLPYTLARQTELVGYGPVNTSALVYVSPDAREHLPTFPANWSVSFVVDPSWWAEHEAELKTRWLSWKSQ